MSNFTLILEDYSESGTLEGTYFIVREKNTAVAVETALPLQEVARG